MTLRRRFSITTITASYMVAMLPLASVAPVVSTPDPIATEGRVLQSATDQTAAAVAKIKFAFENGLPMAGNWNATTNGGFEPSWQVSDLINGAQGGKVIIPWFRISSATVNEGGKLLWDSARTSIEAPLRFAAEHKLPIALVYTQLEATLVTNEYRALPLAQNPTMQNLDGTFSPVLSPLGAVAPWQTLGTSWATTDLMAEMQKIYPDPPLVLMVSNDESPILKVEKECPLDNQNTCQNILDEKRYVDAYGTGRGLTHQVQTGLDGYNARYAALFAGIRQGLTTPWASSAKFIGYNDFGNRFGITKTSAPPVRLPIDPLGQYWSAVGDGVSARYYLDDWSVIDYDMVQSPQVEANNVKFAIDYIRQTKPDFWHEVSTWTGLPDKMSYWEKQGQVFSSATWQGLIRFLLMVEKPNSVRDYRNSTDKRDQYEDLFRVTIDAVTEVSDNATIRDFFLNGTVVANPVRKHPYSYVPADFADMSRWFMLDVDLNEPMSTWTSIASPVKVFSVAHVKGSAPNREWLLFAHAPRGDEPNAKITVPGFGEVSVPVKVSGSYFRLIESDRSIMSVPVSVKSSDPILSVPYPPEALTVAVASNTQINLSWQDGNKFATTTQIERAVGGEAALFSLLTTVNSGVFTYSDTNLTPGQTYKYRVRACNQMVCSLYSSQVTVKNLGGGLLPSSPPLQNIAPVISGVLSQYTVKAGEELTISLVVTDADKDSVTVSIKNAVAFPGAIVTPISP